MPNDFPGSCFSLPLRLNLTDGGRRLGVWHHTVGIVSPLQGTRPRRPMKGKDTRASSTAFIPEGERRMKGGKSIFLFSLSLTTHRATSTASMPEGH